MSVSEIEMDPWFDSCLLANSADMVTQLQLSIVGEKMKGTSLAVNAHFHKLTEEECVHQLNLLRDSLELSYDLLQSGDKNYVYDCNSF